jgi:hypothetical protein
MVDAFKGRWKAKLFAKEHVGGSPPEDPKPKTQTSFKLDADVNEYAPAVPCLQCPLQPPPCTLLTATL